MADGFKEYDRSNRCSLWKNDRRETDRHPHFTGEANVGGKDYRVSAWKKKAEHSDQAPVLTMSFTEKTIQTSKPDFKVAEEDDDIPW